jgi:hypothetical protein
MFDRLFDEYIRAGNTHLTTQELETLAESQNYRVRVRVAENPATPNWILAKLARDQHPDVRLTAGINPKTPVDIVFSLILDEDPTVRLGLAEEPLVPIGVLKALVRDENPYVSEQALRTIRKLQPKLNISGFLKFDDFLSRSKLAKQYA